jgi:D-lactate dehydrogenase
MQNWSHLTCLFSAFLQGDGSTITLQPGLIGGEVNRILQHFHKKNKTAAQYKIGPDPSSIDSCMMGGIVANNSSGMCCGVSQNTYHTLKEARIVFVDGTVLDTSDPASRQAFEKSHAPLLSGIADLARRVQVCILRHFVISDCTLLSWWVWTWPCVHEAF